MAKPEKMCPIWSCSRPFPDGRVDLNVLASRYSISGFALVMGERSIPVIDQFKIAELSRLAGWIDLADDRPPPRMSVI